MRSKRQQPWEERSCCWAKRPTRSRTSSRIPAQEKRSIETVRTITRYVTCSGRRCIMKQRDAFLAALGLLLVWQVLAMFVNLPILPAPVKVFTVFIDELGNGLLKHFVYSLWRVFAGMLLAVLLAVPVGLVVGGSKTLNRMFSPLIYL